MGISVSVLPDEGPPQVGIDLEDLDTSGSTYNVEWTIDGFTWKYVTGSKLRSGAGADFIREPYPPLNLPVTYRLTILSGDTPTGPLEATVTVPASTAFIQDARNPRMWVALELDVYEGHVLAWGSLTSAAYEQAVDLVQPIGGREPVASVGQRMVAGEVPLKVDRTITSEASELRRLLMSSGFYVVRGVPSDLLEPVATVILTVKETQANTHMPGYGISTFDMVARQVRPFTFQIAVPWWTFDVVRELWEPMTFDEVKASRPGASFTDWQRDPEPL